MNWLGKNLLCFGRGDCHASQFQETAQKVIWLDQNLSEMLVLPNKGQNGSIHALISIWYRQFEQGSLEFLLKRIKLKIDGLFVT